MTEADPLLERLAELDPAASDAPPQPGSTRHDSILERAMTPTPTPTTTDLRPRRPGIDGRRRRRVAGGLVAAAAVVAGIIVFEPDRGLRPSASPAAAVTTAGENTEDELTYRSEYRTEQDDGSFVVIRSEFRGVDERRTRLLVGSDGTERPAEPPEEDDGEYVVRVGDQGWTSDDGSSEPFTIDDARVNAPYASSSAAILDAAATETTTTEVGAEEVRGVEATHYRIDLDQAAIDRLAELPPNQLSAFELEYPANVRTLEVWVADDRLRRVRVTQDPEPPDSSGTTVEFYDFGADIDIRPPS